MAKGKVERIREVGKFVYVADFASPESIVVKDVGRIALSEVVSSDGIHYITDFCWPYSEDILKRLTGICSERAGLKKAFDDSMNLVYRLQNEIARGEL